MATGPSPKLPSAAAATGGHVIGKEPLGMAMFALAMLIVPLMDAGAKYLGESLAPFFIALLRYAVQTTLLVLFVKAIGRNILPGTRAYWPQLALAGFMLAMAIGTLFVALQYLPLANTVAIFFVEPLILTVFSAWFLGEKVGWHRTGAVIVGLIGAMVVLRPNVALYGWPTLLPLVCATGFAGTMIVFRQLSNKLDILRIQTLSGAFATFFLALTILVTNVFGVRGFEVTMPTAFEWWLLVGIGMIATFGQTLITMAVKFAEASAVAPFQYLEIVGATILGYLLFDEFPDRLTILGTAIILLAGFYIIHRERRLARARIAIRAPN